MSGWWVLQGRFSETENPDEARLELGVGHPPFSFVQQ